MQENTSYKFAKFTSPFIELTGVQIISPKVAERVLQMNKNKITPERIGANIRRIRLEHKETQQELGEYLGYGPTTIANYESGYRLPDLVTFFKIACHYESRLEDFME